MALGEKMGYKIVGIKIYIYIKKEKGPKSLVGMPTQSTSSWFEERPPELLYNLQFRHLADTWHEKTDVYIA